MDIEHNDFVNNVTKLSLQSNGAALTLALAAYFNLGEERNLLLLVPIYVWGTGLLLAGSSIYLVHTYALAKGFAQ